MEEYLGKEYKGAVSSLQLKQGTAKDSGNPYFYLSIKLINGYETRVFLNDDKKFAIKDAFEQVSTHKAVEDSF